MSLGPRHLTCFCAKEGGSRTNSRSRSKWLQHSDHSIPLGHHAFVGGRISIRPYVPPPNGRWMRPQAPSTLETGRDGHVPRHSASFRIGSDARIEREGFRMLPGGRRMTRGEKRNGTFTRQLVSSSFQLDNVGHPALSDDCNVLWHRKCHSCLPLNRLSNGISRALFGNLQLLNCAP